MHCKFSCFKTVKIVQKWSKITKVIKKCEETKHYVYNMISSGVQLGVVLRGNANLYHKVEQRINVTFKISFHFISRVAVDQMRNWVRLKVQR